MIDGAEVGRRVSPRIRLAFEVDDTRAATRQLSAAGAEVIGEPVVTPWKSLNSRLQAPAGIQLTLFEENHE
jgi:lactoylglutathione lyase